jgi:hypothetical protein
VTHNAEYLLPPVSRPCWAYRAQIALFWAGADQERVYVVMPSAAWPVPEITVVNCVLLWARPVWEAALSACEDKVLRLVGEHSGRVLERGTVLPGSQHDSEPPKEVQFLEMPSEASLEACVNEPRRPGPGFSRRGDHPPGCNWLPRCFGPCGSWWSARVCAYGRGAAKGSWNP